MNTTRKLGVWIATAVLSFVFAPQAWAAGNSSSTSAVSATSATAVVSASSSAVPAALQKALALPEGKERDKAVTAAAVEWQKSDPAAAFAWVVALPINQSNQGFLLETVALSWAVRDPAAAVACAWGCVKARSSNFGGESRALHLTLVQWANSDPKAAAAWADATVPADSPGGIIYWVYGSIADGYADPAAATAWAETLKDDKKRYAALRQATHAWSNTKPEDAAVWAKHLSPADQKISAGYIFNALYKRDAAKATAWLDSLTIPDEMKADLKKKAEATKPKP